MIKVHNKSVKPIKIGDVSLLPGKTEAVDDVFSEAVDFYAKMGFVERKTEAAAKAGKKARAKNTEDKPEDEASDTASAPAGES